MMIHPRHEFGLPAIARMSDLLRDNVEFRQGGLRIPPDCNNAAWPQRLKQPRDEWSTNLALGAGMTTVGHRVAPLVWVQRKNVPKKDWLFYSVQNIPDDGGGALRQRGAVGGTGERQRSVKLTMRPKVNFVSERQARPAPAAIAKVACNPEGGYALSLGCLQNMPEVRAADRRCISIVELSAAVPIRVENGFKVQITQFLDEIVGAFDHRVHLESRNTKVNKAVTPFFHAVSNKVFAAVTQSRRFLLVMRYKMHILGGRLPGSPNVESAIVVCPPTRGYRLNSNSEGLSRS